MNISRIFFNGDLVSGQTVLLDLDRSHYILDVLRLKIRDSLILFNGHGEELFRWTWKDEQRFRHGWALARLRGWAQEALGKL